MSPRRLLNRLYYFTVEDEGILAEAVPKFETDAFCITYKVVGTDDVFVGTAEIKDAIKSAIAPFGEGKRAIAGALVSLSESTRETFDSKAFKKAHPALASEFTKSSTTVTLRVTY